MAAPSSSSSKPRTPEMQRSYPAALRRGISKDDAAEFCACDTSCHALQQHIVSDCHHSSVVQQHRLGGSSASCEVSDPVTVRKLHKADREKLRRDRLNEQLFELAGALEPDRPKNDKSSILGDAIQAVKDLPSEVKRLRAEHALISDESGDLAQEKKELQDEQLMLRAGVERLQCQMQQHMQAMLSWMTLDPATVMGAGGFPYPVPVPQKDSSDFHSPHSLALGQLPVPFVAPGPYISVPILPGSIAMHPTMQAYNRQGGRDTSYFPYPYNYSLAQIPSSLQSASGYPLEVQPNSLNPSIPEEAGYYRPYPPGFSFMSSQSHSSNREDLEESHAGARGTGIASSHLPDQNLAVNSRQLCDNDSSQQVQTKLQLQTPSYCSAAQPQQVSGSWD